MTKILIADSGSTKTEWTLINNNQTHTFKSAGINPFYAEKKEIVATIKSAAIPPLDPADKIYFYGAGCINSEKCSFVSSAINEVFPCEVIFVATDLLGAARSLCQNTPGIACILGTGSNSCFYDGKDIVTNVSPLGFILGDEGSGAVLGKKLIADILKKQLPSHIIQLFFDSYKTTSAEILEAVYKKPFPNRYLAQFTRFISLNITFSELETIVLQSFAEFVSRNVMQYKEAKATQIHFTGSIAYVFREQLAKTMREFDLNLGKIVQNPMEGLSTYHIYNR